MVLEGGLPAPLQLYAAAAAGLGPRPAWPPFLPFFGVPPPFLARPRLPHPLPTRAPHGPPSEDSNEDGGSSKGRSSEAQAETTVPTLVGSVFKVENSKLMWYLTLVDVCRYALF